MCAQLPIKFCKEQCHPDCQYYNCNSSLIPYESCINIQTEKNQLQENCQAMILNDYNQTNIIIKKNCASDEITIPLSRNAVMIFVGVFIVLIFILLIAYYNCNIRQKGIAPFRAPDMCPGCCFPRKMVTSDEKGQPLNNKDEEANMIKYYAGNEKEDNKGEL